MALRKLCLLLLLVTSSAWADDPVQIERTSSSAVAGPLGCPVKSTAPSINVRLHSLKTSSGMLFVRKTLSEEHFACFEAEGSQILVATNIKHCAEATEAAGLQMYRWEANVCTGYTRGIPKGATCRTNEAVVLYSVDDSVKRPQAYTLTLHHSVSSIWAEWEGCLPNSFISVGRFELTWNGGTIPLNGTTFGYRLKDFAFCDDDLSQVADVLKAVTLSAFDDSNNPVMAPVTETLVAAPYGGSRYKLQSINCLYYDANEEVDYDRQTDFCRETLYGNLFIEYKDGDFETYRADLVALRTAPPSIEVSYHYVGLTLKDGQWTWLSGLPQPTIDTGVWQTSMSLRRGDCAYVVRHDHGLNGYKCTDTDNRQACHEYLP